ncbi:MAG: sigma-70 family RNA polymerase sigma factor, partial [Alicyclobacillus sp.]|nr:sigma-70 family RNA polymerase sigma factor [Alicyclobacillus sp.]
ITHNANDVDDLTQDILIKAYRSLDAYRGGSFRAYVARIARNHCYDVARKARARAQDVELPETLVAPEPGPEDQVVQQETLAEVAVAVRQLKEVDQEILLLRHVHAFSFEEIAEATGLQEGAVRTRLTRARQRIMRMVEGRERCESPQLG